MKNVFKRFIKKLADENSKTFPGNGKLDCCGLNKDNKGCKNKDPKK
ncbi:hypothetical protein CLLI_05100 [Clostridium liquoris]|uniref:Uncharacterized protein n=1 Tax=Clostridium liquoris TaxID=1289519 RepID=A0A2T0B8B7_9CLOT|nr:LDCC motif putative metal-binding protein [Clostridium liquoris]PRR80126.1 hypothetical protein CLLI_05100 [Clostridium liquoris]